MRPDPFRSNFHRNNGACMLRQSGQAAGARAAIQARGQR